MEFDENLPELYHEYENTRIYYHTGTPVGSFIGTISEFLH